MNNYQLNGFNYGWICPKCGCSYSPTQTECYRCNNSDNLSQYKIDVFMKGENKNGLE